MKTTLRRASPPNASTASTASARSTSWARRRASTPRRCWCATSRSTCRELLLEHLDAGRGLGRHARRDRPPRRRRCSAWRSRSAVTRRRGEGPRGHVRGRGARRRRRDLPRQAHALHRRREEDRGAPGREGGEGGRACSAQARVKVTTYCYQCVAGPDLLDGRRSWTASPPRSSRTSAPPASIPAAARSASRPTAWCRRPTTRTACARR